MQAFSVATPAQVVAVSSYSERMFLTDQQNYCILFISDRSLNIAFSRAHMFQTYNDSMSEKKENTMSKENPAKNKLQPFLEIGSIIGTTVGTSSNEKLARHRLIG